ncbi:hypothetical protein ACLB2K_025784 [Fragaria x ananassa]
MAPTMAFMTASLIFKLSLRQEDEPIDLGFLEKGFIVLRFYLVGKLNSTRVVQFNSFRSATHVMWRSFVPVEVQQQGDRFLFTFNSEHDLLRMKKGDP